MAENNTPTAPTFQFNQVYLKDASFESPCSPEVFGPKNSNRNPAIDVQLRIQHQRVVKRVARNGDDQVTSVAHQ